MNSAVDFRTPEKYLVAFAISAGLAQFGVVLVARSARTPVNANWRLEEAVVGLTNFIVHVAHHLFLNSK